MQYGFIIPGTNNVRAMVDMGREAEDSGWDGIFYYDDAWTNSPWVVLAGIALKTERVRIGAILHPLAWLRPWLFARDTATLDQLSGGRLIVALGLGAVDDDHFERGYTPVGEPTDRKLRARKLDEGLEIVNALWSNELVTFRGEHYHLEDFRLTTTPMQSPRIPIWMVGAWPHRKSMQRALRCDGLLPDKMEGELTPDDLREIKSYIDAHREPRTPFDIVSSGRTPGDDKERSVSMVRRWEEAGATWWTEEMWSKPNELEDVRERIRQGPPRRA